MNALQRQQVTEQIASEIAQTILDKIEECGPSWSEPYVALTSSDDELKLYVSLTDEDEYDQYLSWEEFAKDALDHDIDLLRLALPKFAELAEAIKEEINRQELEMKEQENDNTRND